MGILNVTPDSFFDGGRTATQESALKHARVMLDQGADIIDVGGESSRPGAEPVPLDEELNRVVPVIRRLKEDFGCALSVDTYKSEVAREAVAAGADIINDITGFSKDSGMAELAASHGTGVVVMHMQGTPRTMQKNPQYNDVVEDISAFLVNRVEHLQKSGVEKDRVAVDPGIGFGKTVAHNLDILGNIELIKNLCGCPVLIGASRKSFIGKVLGDIHPGERLAGSIAAAVTAVSKGADIVRVHDVLETVQALTIFREINNTSRME
jgi:dihydropteroate synthase